MKKIEGLQKVTGEFGVSKYVYKNVIIKKAVGRYAHGYNFATNTGRYIATTINEAVAMIDGMEKA